MVQVIGFLPLTWVTWSAFLAPVSSLGLWAFWRVNQHQGVLYVPLERINLKSWREEKEKGKRASHTAHEGH